MDRACVEETLRAFFESSTEPVACVYLFGSVARGEPSTEDVIVALLYHRPMPQTLESPHFEIASRLESELRCRVDLIDLDQASADLIYRVLRDGRLITDRDPSRRIAFEVRSRNEYFDLEPVRREYRRLGRTTS
jgi:predicted nucleotidyltransferase